MEVPTKISPNLLDEIAFAAALSVIGKLDRAQVNKLIEVLEITRDLDIVVAFLARQAARGEWPREAASRVYRILNNVSNVDEARLILGLYKWLFEAGSGLREKSYQIRQLVSSYRSIRSNQPAPKGFYNQYIQGLLL